VGFRPKTPPTLLKQMDRKVFRVLAMSDEEVDAILAQDGDG